MAFLVPTTTVWSKLMIIPKVIIWILVLFMFINLVDIVKIKSEWFQWIIFAPLFFGSIYIYNLTFSRWLNTLSVFLYIRINLGTKVNWNETLRLEWLFLPNPSGQWWPLDFIRNLPEGLKRKALFESESKLRKKIINE